MPRDLRVRPNSASLSALGRKVAFGVRNGTVGKDMVRRERAAVTIEESRCFVDEGGTFSRDVFIVVRYS